MGFIMTEEQADEAHERYEEIAAEILSLCLKRMEGLSDEQQGYISSKLNDEFRFWRLLA